MSSFPRIESMDALRGWAFLGVMTVHVASRVPELPGQSILLAGAYGVQLFFLLSVLTLIGSFEKRSSEPRPIGSFFLRRLFRIAPLFWFGIVFYLCWRGLAPRYWAPHGIGLGQIVSTATFTHGWTLTSMNSVVPGGWSIAVEMTFYLCLPLLLISIRSLAAACLWCGGAILLASVLTAVLNRCLPPYVDPAEHYLIAHFLEYWFPAQLPVFLLGFVCHFALGTDIIKNLFTSRWSGLIVVIACAVLLTLTQVPASIVPKHILFALPLAVLTVSVISLPQWYTVNRALCRLGIISYSCYLMHFCVVDLVFAVCHSWFATWPASLGTLITFAIAWPVTLVLTAIAATITYHWIEKPGIQLGRSLIIKFQSRSANKT